MGSTQGLLKMAPWAALRPLSCISSAVPEPIRTILTRITPREISASPLGLGSLAWGVFFQPFWLQPTKSKLPSPTKQVKPSHVLKSNRRTLNHLHPMMWVGGTRNTGAIQLRNEYMQS